MSVLLGALLTAALASADAPEGTVRSDQLFILSRSGKPAATELAGEILVSNRIAPAGQPPSAQNLYRFADGFRAVVYTEGVDKSAGWRLVIVDPRTSEWFGMCVPKSGGDPLLPSYVTSLAPSKAHGTTHLTAKERSFMVGMVQRIKNHVGGTGPEFDPVLSAVDRAGDSLAELADPISKVAIDAESFASSAAAGARVDEFERDFGTWGEWEDSPAVAASARACHAK
jgi:hypothetical protein